MTGALINLVVFFSIVSFLKEGHESSTGIFLIATAAFIVILVGVYKGELDNYSTESVPSNNLETRQKILALVRNGTYTQEQGQKLIKNL